MVTANKATVTGVTGAGVSLTSKVFNDLLDIDFDIFNQIIHITYDSTYPKKVDIQYSTITTVTYSIAAGVATITIS